MHDPSLATGILDNFTKVQRVDGSYPGHNYSCRPARDFYHSDIGTGMQQLRKLHPAALTDAHVESLRRYADYLVTERAMSEDAAKPTMYAVFDQNETGQEYMSRYQFASEAADKWASFRVGGVDATVYVMNAFFSVAALLGFKDKRAAPYHGYGQAARKGLS